MVAHLSGRGGDGGGESVGVGGGAAGGMHQPGPAVAQSGVGDVGELAVIGEAPDEGLLGDLRPAGVADRDAGDLLGTGDSRVCRSTRKAGAGGGRRCVSELRLG
jgi:hypothetical protein